MIKGLRITLSKLGAAVVSVLFLGNVATAYAVDINLTGAKEVPAVQTRAHGQGNITVAADHSVSSSVTTYGIKGTMAHIHIGAMCGACSPAPNLRMRNIQVIQPVICM